MPNEDKPFYEKVVEKRDFKLMAYSKVDNAIIDNLTIMQTAFNDSKLSLLYRVLNEDNFIPLFYTERKDQKGKELYEYDFIEVEGFNKILFIKNTKEGYQLFSTKTYDEEEYIELFSLAMISTNRIKRIGNLFERPELLNIYKIKELEGNKQ